MAVNSLTSEGIGLSPSVDRPPSRSASDVASESSSIGIISPAADTPDRNDQSDSSLNPKRDLEPQSPGSMKSEEYRQLFRLPSQEVLLQDFNCALQESILLQGHMYLFPHYICFYSNIFGFETKKIIPFSEITSVKRAKMAGIFPNAIEIIAGEKKYFFASFLSRDEAFKLITDGWFQCGNGSKAITEQQETVSGSNSPESGIIVAGKVDSFKEVGELDSQDRHKDASPPNDYEITPDVENDTVPVRLAQAQDNLEQDVEPVGNTEPSSSAKTLMWNIKNSDVPDIPKSYKRVAETKFPIKVEEFFNLFFSDDAVNFIETFHQRCGDKEFRCSSWCPHEKFGHARDVCFLHPIKIYFGAKYGSCQEVQKFQVYKDSHLVIETSQEISGVPFSDYFTVEGLWDVVRDGNGGNGLDEGCILHVYVDVAFSKSTVWKGKIVQSTLEECREAYSVWTNMAHELLNQKPEKREVKVGECPSASIIQNGEVHSEREATIGETSERSQKTSDRHRGMTQASGSKDVNQQVGNLLHENFVDAASLASLFGDYIKKFCSFLRSQNQVSLILVIAFTVIFLMQVSIMVLLNRTQNVHMASPADYRVGSLGSGVGGRSPDTIAWLERRAHHLKDEMYMVEAQLERLRHEFTWLKAQLKDLDIHSKQK